MSGIRVAVLSPHRDDAAFSCALTIHALLCGGAAITVFNVFTRSDYAVDLSTVRTDMPLVEGVSAARLLEDEAYIRHAQDLASVDAKRLCLHDLCWFDAPLRLAVNTEQVLASPLDDRGVAEQAETLARELQTLAEFDAVFAPLALGDHIDHRIAREAARLIIPAEKFAWYEDLPYAARIPAAERNGEARRVTRSTRGAMFDRYRLQVADGAHLKNRFAMHYPSQIAPAVADEMAEYASSWADQSNAGVERWFAAPACAATLRPYLLAGGATLALDQE